MVRLLAVVLGGMAALAIVVYSMYRAFMTPERRLSSQFRDMKGLILESVDEEDRAQAEQLLEDCREHLDSLIQMSSQLQSDDRQSLKRLQDFTDELGERQHILEDLDEAG